MVHRIVTRRALCVAMLALTACAAEGRRFEPAAVAGSSEIGTLYVYRPLSSMLGRGEDPYVAVNGESLGRIKAGGYVRKMLPVGEYKVTVRQTVLFVPTWPQSVEVAVASNASTYVRVDQRITKFGGTEDGSGTQAMQQAYIEEVATETGRVEILETKENL